MTFDPFLNAPVYIQIHAPAALIALMLGPIALYRRKRDRAQKVVGYVWMVAMLTTAITSFWIREIMADGSMSPVHLLSIFSICTIVYAIWMARRGNILGHKRALQNLYFMGSWGRLRSISCPIVPFQTCFLTVGQWARSRQPHSLLSPS